ncbi:GMC family oxidoreductase [Pseudokineococcus sp. 1T1Z-3]|uniref:GMC family oxidoreductase n=1 Tax=Pseudokineococcus sp. 1T1Z-3 TaxID=3132745 RepID=UPI00309E7C14
MSASESTGSRFAVPGAVPTDADYVVVGGGSGGAVVAARLSEDPGTTVVLLEAGPTDVGDPAILPVREWMKLLESGYDWDYPVEPQENGNSFMRHSRAKVLGGCSSHNSCIAFWAPAEDLDSWATEHGATGWDAESVLPLFTALEDNADEGAHHGHDGPVRLRTIPGGEYDACGTALLAACEEAGIPNVRFNDGTTVVEGASWFQVNVQDDGTRASSSVSYLHPVLDRPNLHVLTGWQVTRLVVEDGRCTGVEVADPDLVHTHVVPAAREVVLSAGAVDSPKLLMLSGIGPAEHLREMGVEVLVDSPGVGEHLQDHPEGVIQWEARQPMTREALQWFEIGIFTQTPRALAEGFDRPDLMFHYGQVAFDMHTRRQGYPTTDNGFCLTPNVTHARSRGTVRLRSRDFRDKPRVDPRYFTDPHDMEVMVAGLRKAREIVAQPAMAEWVGRELSPGAEVTSDEGLAEYVRRTHNTVYHPAGTVRMGADDDAMSPLDARLRVKGVEGLRVADASVMPELTTVNPNITTMVIGEKCAVMVREDALAGMAVAD